MSSEGLLKNGKKKVVIVGGGAAGMVCFSCYRRQSSLLTFTAVLCGYPRPASR